MEFSAMTERELSAHLNAALSTPSGRVLREFLRRHSFMQPGPRPRDWTGREQVEFRYGRMTLFQLLDWYADPANFPDTPDVAATGPAAPESGPSDPS